MSQRSTLNRPASTPARTGGILFALATAVVSGVSVFVNGFGVRAWAEVSDPATYTTLKNLGAAAILISLLWLTARGRSVVPEARRHWRGLLVVAVVGGSIPFLLFFEGLAQVTSSDGAFIHKTLVIWVTLGAVVFLRERIGPWHIVALALLIGGQAALGGGVAGISMGRGEVLILIATLLWAVEAVVAKRLLADVSPLALAGARMGGGALILIGYGLVTGGLASIGSVGLQHFGWILLTSITLAAYVGTWYAALSRAQAVDVSAVLVGGALITAVLETGVRGLAAPPALGVILVMAGVAAVLVGRMRAISPR
ncbi:MAG TPA: DMT family transporter [Acidimicrobiia bacterium]|nr:DMT family transporter [Acidimicrobiia bacterium]